MNITTLRIAGGLAWLLAGLVVAYGFVSDPPLAVQLAAIVLAGAGGWLFRRANLQSRVSTTRP
ncbi:MAG: hypothetical protein WAN48_01785 [Actinomycetes bacterium]